MVQYAETARRDGVLALETVGREAPDPFLRRGLQLTIDGTDPEIIERILRIEIEAMNERHKHGKHFFGTLAKFGPGFGLMATLIAQVAMFRHLDGDAASSARRWPSPSPARSTAASCRTWSPARSPKSWRCARTKKRSPRKSSCKASSASRPATTPASSRCSCSAS